MELEWTPGEPVGLVLEPGKPAIPAGNDQKENGTQGTGLDTLNTFHRRRGVKVRLLWFATTGSKLSRSIPTKMDFWIQWADVSEQHVTQVMVRRRMLSTPPLVLPSRHTSEGTRMTCLQFCVLQEVLWEAEWEYGICNHATIYRSLRPMEKQLNQLWWCRSPLRGSVWAWGRASGIIHSVRK